MLEPEGAIAASRSASMHERIAMYNANTLKIGIFGANCSSGRSATKVPERWSASWPDCLRLARMADDAGIDFMLPIARWKGYGGDTEFHGSTLETVTWAAGLLGATKRITVFGTVHAPLFHPLIAAKEFVTADHIGEGRFGVNLVVGWNEGEFEMFGVTQREHDARYDYAQEWLDAVKRAWSEPDVFDFDGQFVKLKNVRGLPQALRRDPADPHECRFLAGRPGLRAAQLRRVLRRDRGLAHLARRQRPEGQPRSRHAARGYGREIEVYTVGQVICRPTQQEAEEYYRHAIIENADWGAIDGMLAIKNITPQTLPAEEYAAKRRYFAANAIGGYPFVGTPDRVAEELHGISQAGVRGIALSFVNYLRRIALLLRRGAAAPGTSRHARAALKPWRPPLTRPAHAASAFDPATKDRLITLDRAEAECA